MTQKAKTKLKLRAVCVHRIIMIFFTCICICVNWTQLKCIPIIKSQSCILYYYLSSVLTFSARAVWSITVMQLKGPRVPACMHAWLGNAQSVN